MGRTLLSKALIKLSADEWGCTPSLVVVWPEATQPWCLENLCQEGPSWPAAASVPVVSPCRPRPPQETLQHEQVVQSPVGLLLLSSGSWYMQNFVCAFQDWSLSFSQSNRSPIIKSHWPLRPHFLGIPSPFVRSPGCAAWHGVQNLHNRGKGSLVLQFPSPWVTHPVGVGFGFIDGAAPLPLSCCGFFVFGRGVSVFFGEFQCPPVDGCSTVSCCFGAFAGGDEHTCFYSAILNQDPISGFNIFLSENVI